MGDRVLPPRGGERLSGCAAIEVDRCEADADDRHIAIGPLPAVNSARKTRVLIVNLGTPEEATPESVRAFLEEFLTDPLVIDWPGWLWRPILNRFVLRSRPQRVAALYESIWTPDGSPLAAGTRRIAEAVGVAARGAFEVGWAFRYGPRSIDRAFRELLPTCDKLAVIPLFPQRTGSTSGSIRREAESVARRYDAGARMRLAALEPDDPDYVRALADRYRQAMRSHSWAPQHLLISFHGIPTRYDRREGRIYTADCARTCVALLRELDWDPSRTTLCYQSKFGPEPWLVRPPLIGCRACLARGCNASP